MATGIIQTPDRMSSFGTLRSATSPITINVPSGSQHLLFFIANSAVYVGMYLVNCIAQGTVGVNEIKPYTTTTMTIDTSTNNKIKLTSTSTTYVNIRMMTLSGDKAYL